MAVLYDLKDAYARVVTSGRCYRCSHFTSGNAVKVVKRLGQLPHYVGLQHCGLTHECPTCSARIKAQRSGEVRHAVEWHAARWGHEAAWMLTLTVRHGMGDDLKRIRQGVALAWRKFVAGKAWKTFQAREGFQGSIRALEVTHGWNGWHPHLHVIFLMRGAPTDELRAWMFRRWSRYVRAVLGDEHVPLEFDQATGDPLGVDLRSCNKADYIAKLGLEVTNPNTKRGRGEHRTPLEILADFADAGTWADARLYVEYAKAMKGARQLTWSGGLKVRADVAELTDQEAADSGDDVGENVATISRPEWCGVRQVEGAKAAVLEVAEEFGGVGVYAVVDRLLGRPPSPNLSHRLLDAIDMLVTIQYSRTQAIVA